MDPHEEEHSALVNDRRKPAEPVPVAVVATAAPIPVEVVVGKAKTSTGVPPRQDQTTDPSVPARTTYEEDLSTAGQRHINVMWEGTQKNIALMVTTVALGVTAFLVTWPTIPHELRLLAYGTLSNVFFAVTSVYFTRTNHTKIGGVGPHDEGR